LTELFRATRFVPEGYVTIGPSARPDFLNNALTALPVKSRGTAAPIVIIRTKRGFFSSLPEKHDSSTSSMIANGTNLFKFHVHSSGFVTVVKREKCQKSSFDSICHSALCCVLPLHRLCFSPCGQNKCLRTDAHGSSVIRLPRGSRTCRREVVPSGQRTRSVISLRSDSGITWRREKDCER